MHRHIAMKKAKKKRCLHFQIQEGVGRDRVDATDHHIHIELSKPS